MNPELPQNPREEMELRITALLLGELSADEAAAVREAIAKDPALAKLHDDLKETIQLVRTAATSMGESAANQATPLQLSEARRQMLLTSFAIPPLKPSHRKPRQPFQFRLAEALAVLAIIAVLAAMLLPTLIPSRGRMSYAITTLPAKRGEEEYLTLGVASPEPASAGGRAANGVSPVPGTRGVDPANVVGYVEVATASDAVTASAAAEAATRQVRLGEQISEPRGNVSFGEKSEAKSRADYDDYLKYRNLAAGQPVATPAPTVLPPATTQPRLQIALPSLNEADTDGLADNGARQKDRSDSAVALFANGLDSTRGLDRNGRGPSGPAETPASQNHWAASPALRGFYDSSGRQTASDFGISDDTTRTEAESAFRERYGLARSIAPTTDLSAAISNPDDQTHTINARPTSVSDERAAASLKDSFVIGAEPKELALAEPTRTLSDPVVAGDAAFGRFKSDSLERGRADSAEGKPSGIALGTDVAAGRFYRFSGGPGGGGGGGGAGRGDAVALSESAEKAPVLGDLPMLGKLFRSESGTSQVRKGGLDAPASIVTSNGQTSDFVGYDDPGQFIPQGQLAGVGGAGVPVTAQLPTPLYRIRPTEAPTQSLEIAANDFSILNFESAQEKLGADKQAWFGANGANNPRDGSTLNAGTLALGLPGIEQKKELLADSFYAGDKLSVNDGRGVPGQQSLGFEVADNPAGVPAKPSDMAAIVLQSTPTTKGVEELAVGRPAVTRLSRRPAPDGGVTTGNTLAPVQEARRLSEGEARLKGRNGVIEAGLAEEQQAGANREQQVAQRGNEVAARRRQIEISDPGVAGTAPTPSLEAESLRRYQAPLDESKVRLAQLETLAAKPQAASPERPKQIESAKVDVGQLQALVDNAQKPDIKKSEDSRAYYDKKRELESLRMFERTLGTKLSAERIDLTIPRTSMVEIVDKAQPAKEKTGGLRGLGVPIGGSYASTARIAVDRDVTDIEGVAGSRSAVGYDPYFTQTQLEIIQSEPVLGEVVESLDLTTTWANNGQKLSTPEAVSLLKQKLDLKPVKNSSLVEIRAKDENPEEAAKIANAVAETYQEHRMQERSRLSQGGIKVLEERYQEQLEKITKAQEEVEALRQRLRISDTDAEGDAPVAPVKVEVDIPLPRKAATNAPIPQAEIQTSENNFSTFSLNVSDVSFKLAAASLEQGQMPDAASVRSEEFINAFDYRDPEPAAGAPIAFAWERARYPFAHNRDLLRFSLKTAAAGRQAGRPLNVVLLLDNSGSMERADRVQIIREALAVLAAQLQPQDKLSVITFARTPRLVADGISGDQAGEVAEQVSGLTPQGGTNFEEGMNLAYQTARRHYLANGINRVVMLTDGAANLGNVEPELLKQQVEAQRKQGIALDCFGIGWEGFNDDLLETLSRNGDGRYGFINSPEEAATDFVGQLAGALKVAASDVKVQVEFNPKRVTAYRQIGYAKHQLTKEQFRDNTVDAAEIAAQEAGNALYTVEVNPAGEGPLGTVRVRYKIPGTTDYREQAWDVPFAGNAAPLEHSSPVMRLAASASAFSEWLVASPFAGEVTPDRLLGYLSGVPEVYGVDSRPKKLEWMIRQAKSVSGQ